MRTFSSLQLLTFLRLLVVAYSDDAGVVETTQFVSRPQVSQNWMYAMVILGFVGSFVIFLMICFAMYNTYYLAQVRVLKRELVALNFSIWIFNLLACIQWAFLRTNMFSEHTTESSCVVIYITNYLCYMIGKYLMHIFLLYRLYIAFENSVFRLNGKFIVGFVALSTCSFLVFTGLWLKTCIEKVTVGEAIEQPSLQICTLYNNSSNAEYTIYQKLWPILFGGQDFVIGVVTMIIFVRRLINLTMLKHDSETELLVRKLTICGCFAIISTFIFYTFAIPFWPNLTFLLPFDAMLNSLCLVLLLEYSSDLYQVICWIADKSLLWTLQHRATAADTHTLSFLDLDAPRPRSYNSAARSAQETELAIHIGVNKRSLQTHDPQAKQTGLQGAASDLNASRVVTTDDTEIPTKRESASSRKSRSPSASPKSKSFGPAKNMAARAGTGTKSMNDMHGCDEPLPLDKTKFNRSAFL